MEYRLPLSLPVLFVFTSGLIGLICVPRRPGGVGGLPEGGTVESWRVVGEELAGRA